MYETIIPKEDFMTGLEFKHKGSRNIFSIFSYLFFFFLGLKVFHFLEFSYGKMIVSIVQCNVLLTTKVNCQVDSEKIIYLRQ